MSGAFEEQPPTSYADAKRKIEATLRANPKNYSMRMYAAKFYMEVGDFAAAIPHLQAATRLTPRVFPWIALGDASTFSGRFSQAQQAYDRALKMDPSNTMAIRGKGQMLIAQGKMREAQALLEAAAKKFPANANILAALGNLYLVINQPRKAIATLKPAVEREPYRADLHALLGEAHERDMHLEAAVREMREAVRLDPKLSEAWGRLGLYLVNLNRFQEARDPLMRAIEQEPMESHYYWALGESYLLESPDPANFEKATQLYQQALNLNPRNEKALYSYGMALARRGQPGDFQKAAGLFQRLLKVKPTDMNAHYKLYEIYVRLGRTKEAQRHRAVYKDLFEKGRVQNRERYRAVSFLDTPELHLKMGQEALARKDYALAAREFQFALQRNPMLGEARRGLEEARKRLGSDAKEGTP